MLTLDYAHYQSEKARPNSAFLCLGTAIRKALAAGLHKNTRFKVEQTTEDAEEKRLTFWSLFFYDMLALHPPHWQTICDKRLTILQLDMLRSRSFDDYTGP